MVGYKGSSAGKIFIAANLGKFTNKQSFIKICYGSGNLFMETVGITVD